MKRLSPVVIEVGNQLSKTKEHKDLFIELNNSLNEVQKVIDYICTHTIKAAFFSKKYLEDLHNALENVDKWIGRIQTVGLTISSQSKTILMGLTEDIKGHMEAIHKRIDIVTEILQSIQLKLDNKNGDISDILNHLKEISSFNGSNIDVKLSDILCLLKDAPVREKNGRFQDFIIEEEIRMIQQLENLALKTVNEQIPVDYLCPITKEVMRVPVVNSKSGYTYEEEALRTHMAQCNMRGLPVTDPMTRVEFSQKHIGPNRSLANLIEKWKTERMNNEVSPPPLPTPSAVEFPLTPIPVESTVTIEIQEFEQLKREKEKWENEKMAAERKLQQDKEEKERDKQELEQLRKEKAEQERKRKEEAEQERKRKEKAEQERKRKEEAEQERKRKEEAEQIRKRIEEAKKVQAQNLIRTNSDIKTAVSAWCNNRRAAEEKYGNISHWDTHLVTSMKELFQGRGNFNDDIRNWNVSNVTDMCYMFRGASTFNQDLSGWNVSEVTNMDHMFDGASAMCSYKKPKKA